MRTASAGGVTVTSELTSANVVPPDTAPDAFALTAQTGVAPGAPVTSDSITVAGINAPAPIGMVGGEYSIAGLPFTAEPGSVVAGQSVQLRQTASTSGSTVRQAVLTVGGVQGVFSVTTSNAARSDLDGNGKADLPWRDTNAASPSFGRNIVRLMNGATRAGSGEIPRIDDANWRVVGP